MYLFELQVLCDLLCLTCLFLCKKTLLFCRTLTTIKNKWHCNCDTWKLEAQKVACVTLLALSSIGLLIEMNGVPYACGTRMHKNVHMRMLADTYYIIYTPFFMDIHYPKQLHKSIKKQTLYAYSFPVTTTSIYIHLHNIGLLIRAY